ncbi:hypothetical protein QBC41DRAFT_60974 [Cercophora samala]|uniref:BTB domain-containing protein n=1 Tax=Cercophora samala TaxID=330535 RepID=A0AA39YJX9_9PEZI|nr:hypothetical protein QBC41DRAFT_60974 [Cercophora samala]
MNSRDPPARQPSLSYARILRGDTIKSRKVLASKSKPATKDTKDPKDPTTTTKEGEKTSPEGAMRAPDQLQKHKQNHKPGRDRNAAPGPGPNRQVKDTKDNSSAEFPQLKNPAREPPRNPLQSKPQSPAEKHKTKSAPTVARTQSYAQVASGKKVQVLTKPPKAATTKPADTEYPSIAHEPTAKMPSKSSQSSNWRNSSDAKAKTPGSQPGSRDKSLHQGSLSSQPPPPALPATDKMNLKSKPKHKGHHRRNSSLTSPARTADKKRHNSSGVCDSPTKKPTVPDSDMVIARQRARRFSAPDIPSPIIEEPENVTSEAPDADAAQLEFIKKRAERTAMVIAAHDRGEYSLWDTQYEWDVLVVCKDRSWQVHHDILSRESEYMRERLPPKDPAGYIRFELDGHDAMQLGYALQFMYLKSYPDAYYDRNAPLSGEPLRFNTFLYIAGASIDYTAMMDFAVARINEATAIVGEYLPILQERGPNGLQEPNPELYNLYNPLGWALTMMYEQGTKVVMKNLRLAMTKFVDVSMLYLILDRGFKQIFGLGWVLYLYPNLVNDAIFFGSVGALDPPNESSAVAPPQQGQHLQECQQQQQCQVPVQSQLQEQPQSLPLPQPTPSLTEPARTPGGLWQASWDQSQARLMAQQPQKKESVQPPTETPTPIPPAPAPAPAPVLAPAPAPAPASRLPNDGVWGNEVWERIDKTHGGGAGHGGRGGKHREFGSVRGARDGRMGGSKYFYPRGSSRARADNDRRNPWEHNWRKRDEPEEYHQPEEVEDEEGNLWIIGNPGPTPAPQKQSDRPEEPEQTAQPGQQEQSEKGNEDLEEERRERPHSVSDDLVNPWDEDTWRPATNEQRKAGGSEESGPDDDDDERSTITAFTPVTSMAGDDVMSGSTMIPVVFEDDADEVGAGEARTDDMVTAITSKEGGQDGGDLTPTPTAMH